MSIAQKLPWVIPYVDDSLEIFDDGGAVAHPEVCVEGRESWVLSRHYAGVREVVGVSCLIHFFAGGVYGGWIARVLPMKNGLACSHFGKSESRRSRPAFTPGIRMTLAAIKILIVDWSDMVGIGFFE